MIFLFDNLNWMIFNLVLACVPIVLVIVLRRNLHPLLHFMLLALWLIFLPNTIYLVTDLQYVPYQIYRSGILEQALLFIEYSVLSIFGVFGYLYSLEPVELTLKKLKVKKGNENLFYIILHFIVAFGVVMGKVQRTHSWYVFTDMPRVIRDVKATFSSTTLLEWVIFVGILTNIFFFLFKKYFPVFYDRRKRKKK